MRRESLFCLGLFALWPLVIAHFDCTAPSDSIMVHDAVAEQAQYGSASELQAGLKQPWPLVVRNNERLRVVKYCYTDKAARDAFHCPWVMDAFTRWARRLGYPASAETGHSLAWEEAHDGNVDPSKRKTEYCFDENQKWNPKVDHGTLWIALNPHLNKGGSATTGYDVLSDEAGRHFMNLGPEAEIDAITHELGHVFGMSHEAQRNDRDEYVYYQCKNVIGYAEALAQAMAGGLDKDTAHTWLCEDDAFARQHNFQGSQFMKHPQGQNHDEPAGFDLQSIMLYPSNGMSNPYCWGDQTACPLLALLKVGEQTVGMERIPERGEPSDRDIAWLKTWYPHEE